MAKAKRKNVEKLGDVVGKTRPVAGFVLLVIGVFFAVSVLGFARTRGRDDFACGGIARRGCDIYAARVCFVVCVVLF